MDLREELMALKEVDKQMIGITATVGLNPEGKLAQLLFFMFNKNVEYVKTIYNKYAEDIDWFIYECEFGDKEKIVEIDTIEYSISNINDFINYLEQK